MTPPGNDLRRQIRGSTLLLAGRLLGAASNFIGQIIMVRYLSKTDYGAFAYALSIITFCQVLSTLGMKTTVSRYVPIFHEKKQIDKLFGVLTIAVAVTTLFGLALFGLLAWSPDALTRYFHGDSTALTLLAVMAFLIPLQGLDLLLINVFASFGKTRAIFVRKFVLTPVLKIGVILVLVLSRSEVVMMAYGYLVGGVISLVFSLWVTAEILRGEGLLKHARPTIRGVSFREIIAFSISILITEAVPTFMHSVNVFILGYLYGPAEVAVYTVVLPAARLNRIVMDNVRVLYLPLAARFFARGDRHGLNDLYWQTAVWMMMATFPVFAVTFTAAGPLTRLLYGDQYASSSVILMMLALAYYLNVALGANAETLRTLGRMKYLLTVDLLVVLVNTVANFVLIRHYGAMGAGLATAGSMILHGALRQLGLRLVDGLKVFDPRYLPFYPMIAVSTATLYLCGKLGEPNIFVSLGMVACISAALFAVTRKRMHVGEMFPELRRVPGIRMLVT